MYRKKRRSWVKHRDFMIMDIICLQLAFTLAYVFRFGMGNPYGDREYRNLAVVFLLIDFFVEVVFDSFKNILKRGYLLELTATCKHVFLVELITAFYLFSTQLGGIYSRISYYVMVPLYILITYIARCLWKRFLRRNIVQTKKKSLLVIAPEERLADSLEEICRNCYEYSEIAAVALGADRKGDSIFGIPVVADARDVMEYVCRQWVDEVMIPPCAQDEYPKELVQQLMEMGIAVHIGIAKAGEITGGHQQVEKIGGYTVITTSLNVAGSTQLMIKRLMDIAGGLAGCLVKRIRNKETH